MRFASAGPPRCRDAVRTGPRFLLPTTVALLIIAASSAARAAVYAGAGYDLYAHGYYLADSDTTETISDLTVFAGLDLRSRPGATRQWFARAELGTGSELSRERLEAGWRWRPGGGEPRARLDFAWLGRQYHAGSTYALVSDNQDGKLEARVAPWRGRSVVGEVRGVGRWLDYRTPSTLEQDYREVGGGLYARAPAGATRYWEAGLRALRRAYPDSAAIDRDLVGLDLSFESHGERVDLQAFHRSERRLAADQDVRPSAWSHWTEARATAGSLVAELTSELWDYEREDLAWVDSWRVGTQLGLRRGDPLGTVWQAALTGENLAAGDSPESYAQAGVLGGLESFGSAFAGSLSVEVGRRWYRGLVTEDDLVAGSDFTYVEVWLLASVPVADGVSLDLTGSYEPERHTESDDDLTLGFASARLTWRR